MNGDGVTLGRARNAVLTAPLGDRGACTEDDMCLWGCGRGAIYSAAQDLPGLMAQASFTYRNRAFVRRITREDDGYTVRFGPAGSGVEDEAARARIVVCAAGTLGSTKLVADFLALHDRALPLMSNPAFALALCLPRRLGAPLPEKGFALGQLGFTVSTGGDADYGHGALFAGTSLLLTDIARYLPLTRPGAINVLRCQMPSLVFLNCFLSGAYSRHEIRLERAGTLAIKGAYSEQFDDRAKEYSRRLSGAFRRLGAYALPGGARVSKPGSDIHYAGTVPMTADSGTAGPSTDSWCALRGTENLFVVDGAVFPHLAAKNPTFTIMANADRVGRHILQRLA